MRASWLVILTAAAAAACGTRTALDIPSAEPRSESDDDPRAGTPVTNVVEIAAGSFHNCARWRDGSVRCWGSDLYGQLGDGSTKHVASCPTSDTTSEPCGKTPVRAKIDRATSIAAGETHSCAVDAEGQAWCWGGNTYGQIGDGTFMERELPVRVLKGAKRIAAGTDHTCAILVNGHVSCWGRNDFGQLGTSPSAARALPAEIEGVADAVELSGSCVVRSDGVELCWGYGGGQKVHAVATNMRSPCIARDGSFACFKCWLPLTTASSVSSSVQASCVVDELGALRCWGPILALNGGCKCNGDDSCEGSVPGLGANVDQVRVGFQHVCVLMKDSTVRCFGDSTFGQLGDGTNRAFSFTPSSVVF